MLIGQKKIWQFLNNSLEQNKLSHAYLFSGQEKLGKKTLAIEFVKQLFKEEIDKRQHPDFIFIGPEKKEIQISQIKECIWRLNLKPSVSPFKIAIIDEAHCLNQEAQNCLLKTLEEPKGNTIIFLITEYPERLFPTIVSRCQTLKFYPVKREEIEKYLKNENVAKNQIEEILDISGGRPGLAIDLISTPDKLKNQKAVISDFVKMANSDLAARFQYAKDLAKEPQSLKKTLDILLGYFRESLISGITTPPKKYSISKLKNIVKLIQETNFLISSTNANPRLALEILMLEV
jgi:DNA polymerase-3 subunit delta'